jgi:spore maturation protein CgeB
MHVVLFCHSLISDWNHGNAHFLRGIVRELQARHHQVTVYEPHDSWSRQQLLAEAGPGVLARFRALFPTVAPIVADLQRLDLDAALDTADLVLVHEWSDPQLVERIGRHKARGGRYILLFHDTHHRSVTDIAAMQRYDLADYDGVLAFGEVIRERYLRLGWGRHAWTWHEAADVRLFRPGQPESAIDDVIWIGNWGDEERTPEIRSYLIEPVQRLALTANVYGVRYPAEARRELEQSGLAYRGWLPNDAAPAAYAVHRMTLHIPRRPYRESLPGIPTIRVFEALACGVPLISVAWSDSEHLFTPGADFLVAHDPAEMRAHMAALASDPEMRAALAAHGLATILRRHTCAHRVDELLAIVQERRAPISQGVLTT